MVQGTIARQAALDILRRVRAGKKFDVALADATEGIQDHDRRLAHEIAAGVLRSRTEFDAHLATLVSGRWDRTAPDLKDLLRIGMYQLTRLDRVPAFAAVQATVEVAKRVVGKGGARLVNAVLRRVADGNLTVRRSDSQGNHNDFSHIYSHPAWLVERWLANFGLEATRALLEHNNRQPKLVIQPVNWTAEELREQLSARGIDWSPAPFGAGCVVENERVQRIPGYREGAFIVQDAAQMRLLTHAAIPDGALVWDACASPGGKAATLSRRGPVIASDLCADRMDRLRDTLNRVAPGVRVLRADARHPPVAPERVDVTLIDAPCSATGTIQRHPDGRWRLNAEMVTAAARNQTELLNGASGAVHPGALLVYMTCSLEPEENAGSVDLFLDDHPYFEREGRDLFLFPPETGTDGGYVARLRRIA